MTTARRTNPFPTHGLVCSADDRKHLMIVDLSEPTPMIICHLIDRLLHTASVQEVANYANDALDRRTARKRGGTAT